MELRSLGTSDIKINPVIMGTWQAGKAMWVGIEDADPLDDNPVMWNFDV